MINTSLRIAASAAALSMAFAFSAAAYTVSPPEGSIDQESYPAGVNSVEISGATFTINREASGYIELFRDGTLIRQIPASNMVDLYTFEGFSKLDSGSVHVTFFPGFTGQAKNAGKYEMTVPAGFFKLSDGEMTEAMSFSWFVAASGLDVTPAGGNVTSLKEFTIELPTSVSTALRSEGITGYSLSAAPNVYLEDYTVEVEENEAVPTIPVNVSLDGNIGTLSLDETITKPGKYVLIIPSGTFTYTTESGRKVSSEETSVSYIVSVDMHGNLDILPAPGTYENFPAQQFFAEGSDTGTDCTFMIKFPESTPLKFALRGSAKLYAMNEDGTYNTATNFGQFSPRKGDDYTLLLISTSGAAKTLTPPAGRYALEIPANYYSTSEGMNAKFYYEYTIDAEMPYSLQPDPAKLLGELSAVTMVFEDDAVLTVGKAYATLTNGIAVYTMSPEFDEATPNQVTYKLPVVLKEKGSWNFISPTSGLLVNDSPFSIEQVYELDPDSVGVEAIEALTGNVDVYSLNGLSVAKGIDFAKTRSLPAGLYIVKSADGTARKIAIK